MLKNAAIKTDNTFRLCIDRSKGDSNLISTGECSIFPEIIKLQMTLFSNK